MTSMSTWYSGQYGNWNRMRRLSTAPYPARQDTNTATANTMLHHADTNGAVIINMGELNSENKDKKKQETLFGPNIGVVNPGPAWTEDGKKKKTVEDQLTPEVVKEWIAKSKESTQPTTTLQALVNLKRPTLRLSPLSIAPTDDPTHKESHDHHGLEFEYDCDAPKCGIYMHVIMAPSSSDGADTSTNYSNKILVFEAIVDGGFGKMLKLEEGATLELGRFERHPSGAPAHSDDRNGAVDKTTNATVAPSNPTDDAPRANHRSRLFNNFHFRKPDQDRVTGPALAVVDAEAVTTAPTEEGKDKENKVEDNEDGVKVTIQLVALDEQGKSLPSPNEQGTYLHVVRLGAKPADGEEDARPWVVKVVKREATIGPHTFHLHEIYGLSSQSSATTQATAPLPITAGSPTTTENDGHTYPPPTASPGPTIVREDEPSSECLLCLSSSREIVLLPCRHLVACKECAINMVEFGAGGQITQPEEAVPAAEGEQATGSGSTTTTPAATLPAATGQNGRRKRRAKGWFCPVCRQPYTSLLRITTTPPTKEEKDIETRPSTSTEGPAEPAAVSEPATLPPSAVPGGVLASLRPAFFRGNSRPSNNATEMAESASSLVPTLPPDLERGPDPAPASGPATVS